MPLNKSTGNMYSWLDSTWCPLVGRCAHACVYCFMWQERLKPLRLEKKELLTDLNAGQFIFVCSSTDMFADNVPEDWIMQVLNTCCDYDRHFLFQSKNPKRIYELEGQGVFPKKHTIATTLETNRDMSAISKAPSCSERVYWMNQIRILDVETTVTIEPIMQFDLNPFVSLVKGCRPSWVSIGADSKGHKLPEPTKGEVLRLISELEQFTKVEKKKNLKRILEAK